MAKFGTFADFVQRKIRLVLDLLSWIYGAIFWPSKQRYLPPIKEELLLLPATELADRIKLGQVKSEDVIKAYISRCKEVHPHLNALVDDNFENALEEAREVDSKVQRALRGEAAFGVGKSLDDYPFLGVPFTCKNSIMAKDKTFSGAVWARKDIKGDRDSVAVERMKTVGGAIFLGITNIPECVMWQDSFNRVDGRTNNPYDRSRIPGGSSGGEGALIASCGSVIGIGSDIGGSIRLPSFCCGIFGHKTTPRHISTDGVFPEYNGARAGVNTLGPMCRYVSDIRPMLQVLAGDSLPLPETPLNFSTLNVHYMFQLDDPFITPIDKDIITGVNKVVQFLSEKGSKVYKLDTSRKFADMRYASFIWFAAMHDPKHKLYIDFITNGKRDQVNAYWELAKCALGLQKKYTGTVLTFALTEELGLWNYNVEHYKAVWQRVRADLHKLLGDNGVLICPTLPGSAVKHNESPTKFNSFNYTALFSALNVAITNVPLGLDRRGMPIGVQVIAGPKNDHLTIKVAEELEQQFGGWVPPCEIKLGN